jgi:hypothetical protein
MKTKRISLSLIAPALLFLFIGCDDDEGISTDSKPDGAALNTWFDDAVDKKIQQFTIDASTGGNFTGEKGTKLEFSSNAFSTLTDDVVTGNVDVELVEIYDRATMLLTKKPTNGKKNDGSISTLVSGGEFYVNATQGDKQLKLKTGFTIVAPTDNTGEISQEMKLFNGEIECEVNDCDLIWNEQEDRDIDVGEIQVTGGFKTAYFVFQTKFGWTNIDRWYNDPRPKTTIYVDVPDGFDNSNCAIYIAYDGEPAALASFDKYDKDKALFTEHYGLIPVGLKVHFILVSIIDDKIQYAIQPATIVENHVEVIDVIHSITEEQLVDLIDELP